MFCIIAQLHILFKFSDHFFHHLITEGSWNNDGWRNTSLPIIKNFSILVLYSFFYIYVTDGRSRRLASKTLL